jgi:hypothetical protein
MNNIIEGPKFGIKGSILSWEVVNQDGSIDRACYTPSDNMILNSGLNMLGTQACYTGYSIPTFLDVFAIGTGTALPTETDTLLGHESYRGTCAYNTWNVDSSSPAGSNPYYVSRQRGVQTPLGALNGTYSEIGFSNSATLTNPLFCKFRLVDEDLVPTSITISSIQQLRLKYVITIELLPAVETSYSTTITGIGPFNYSACWQGVPDISIAFATFYGNYGPVIAIRESAYTFSPIGSYVKFSVYGTNYVQNAYSQETYVSGSYTIYKNVTFSVTDAVWVNKALALRAGTGGTWQWPWVASFDPANYIDKPNTHVLTFRLKFSWARA